MRSSLGPILHRDEYTRALEREAAAWAAQALFAPLDLLLDRERRNEARGSAVAAALLAGTIWFADGAFHGEFNACISKELREMGATLRADGSFRIEKNRLPIPLLSAVAVASLNAQSLHRDFGMMAGEMRENLKVAPSGLALALILQAILRGLDLQAEQAAAGKPGLARDPLAGKVLGFGVEISADMAIAEALKAMALAHLDLLQRRVQENGREGARLDRLREILADWKTGVLRRIATIAEHQAAMIVTAYRRELARRLGIGEYYWHTLRDNRVRKCHRTLDGRIFSWGNPPIADDRTGFRGHPGEAANCRCYPVLTYRHAETAA